MRWGYEEWNWYRGTCVGAEGAFSYIRPHSLLVPRTSLPRLSASRPPCQLLAISGLFLVYIYSPPSRSYGRGQATQSSHLASLHNSLVLLQLERVMASARRSETLDAPIWDRNEDANAMQAPVLCSEQRRT